MANSSDGRSGGFGLGAVVVIGFVCFAAGYLAASFLPVLTGSTVTGARPTTGSSAPAAEGALDRGAVPEEGAETSEEAAGKDAAAAEGEKPAPVEPQKAPTP